MAQEKEEGKAGPSGRMEEEGATARRRELENMGTPYMTVPGGRKPMRTPIGARGWDTPVMRPGEASTRRRNHGLVEADDLDGDFGATPGPSQPARTRRKPEPRRVRDDLSLDAFQRNYTSEDNASFVQIVDEENRQRQEDRWSWAWEAEKKAEQRRIEGEEKRKMILDTATSGNWRVNGEGKRLIGGLAEGGRDQAVGEAWKEERRMLTGTSPGVEARLLPDGQDKQDEEDNSGDSSTALVQQRKTGDLIPFINSAPFKPSPLPSFLEEQAVRPEHPLHKALTHAGLPTTALVSTVDGLVIPSHEIASGAGEGRGRGEEERARRYLAEKLAMGEEDPGHFPLGGSGADQWKYRVRTLPHAITKR